MMKGSEVLLKVESSLDEVLKKMKANKEWSPLSVLSSIISPLS